MARLPPAVAALGGLFAASGIAGIIVVAAAPSVATTLSGDGRLATLPVALMLAGTMATTIPASRVMARHGRRMGFLLGTATAAAGAAICALAIARGSFLLFCLGSFMVGSLAGVAPYYRFAAIELSPTEARARAVAAVLAGGVVAGLAGPLLGAWSADWARAFPFLGSYVLMALVGLVLVLALPLSPMPATPPPAAQGGHAPIGQILRQRGFATAALAASVAMGLMILTMVAAPLSLMHEGHAFSGTALVIQAHVVAMYLPSFATGRLVERLGTGRMMAAGLLLLAACVAVNLAGQSVAHHWVALVLLGLGWNLLFVAATTLLATSHTVAQKAQAQGFNDFAVAATAAAAALGAGPVHAAFGWTGLNLGVLVAGLALGVVLVLMRPKPAPTGAAA